MTDFAEVRVGDLFKAVSGLPRYTRAYLDAHSGEYPVYSASLTAPFGHVSGFDHEGHFLTWVMNGYGGRVQEVKGQFSANRDRGVLVPLDGVRTPDLTYLRYAIEPQFTATAVGRRVDGRLNEYTKIYPDTAEDVTINLPIAASGKLDYDRISQTGAKLRRIEAAQLAVVEAHASLLEAVFPLDVPEPTTELSVGDGRYFSLSIGKRVLESEHVSRGIPVYSANVFTPFGAVASSNLSDFSRPSILWGIDNTNFDWNFIEAGQQFATTDHCGRLQLEDDRLDPEYVYWVLKRTLGRRHFDRVYRASLQNIRREAIVTVPIDQATGRFCLKTQRSLARTFRQQEKSRQSALLAFEGVLDARIGVDL